MASRDQEIGSAQMVGPARRHLTAPLLFVGIACCAVLPALARAANQLNIAMLTRASLAILPWAMSSAETAL